MTEHLDQLIDYDLGFGPDRSVYGLDTVAHYERYNNINYEIYSGEISNILDTY